MSNKIFLAILPFLFQLFIPGNLYSDTGTSDSCYSIQVASYKIRSNADNAVAGFKKLGMDTFLQPKEIPGKGQMYRIYIGRYRSEGEAKKAAEQLRRKKLIENYYCRLIKTDEKEIRKQDDSSSHEGKLYRLHVSSFISREHAGDEVQRLRDQGYAASIKSKEISGRPWYQIFLGKFIDRQKARRAGEEYKKAGIITYFKPVVIEPADGQPQYAERENRIEQNSKLPAREDNSAKKRNDALGRVLAAEGEDVYVIDIGEYDGLENGDILYVFPQVIVEGRIPAMYSGPVATLRIKKVASHWVKGKVIDSNGKVKPYYAVTADLKP